MAAKYRKKLFSNFAALSIIQGANFILPILIMPVVIRRIGADGFGVVSVAQVVMVFLATLADYGLNLTATRDIALYKDDKQQLSRIFSSVFCTKLVLCVAAWLILLLLTIGVPLFREHFLLYHLGFAYVLGQSILVSWFFQGIEKMQYITISTLIARIISVVLIFIFILQPKDNVLFLLFMGIGNILAGVFSVWLAKKLSGIEWYKPRVADIHRELKEGWQVTLSNLSINTFQYVNILVLRLISNNDTIVGYYSVAERVFFAVRQVLGIYSQVVYPHICQLTREGKQQAAAFFRQFYLPFLALQVLGCALLFLLAPWIIHLLMGKQESPVAVLLLRILAFAPVIVCLNIPSYQVLLAFDKKSSYLRIYAWGTAVNLAANLLLCRLWGPVGTATSILITEVFVTIGLNRELYKNDLFAFVKPGAVYSKH